MQSIVTYVGGVFTGLVINYVSPVFNNWANRLINALASHFDGARHDLTGTWLAESDEPASTDTTVRAQVKERIEIRHVRISIVAKSHVVENDAREFIYRLRISHDMVFGEYRKKSPRRGAQAGSGMIQMIVNPKGNRMTGSVTWFDSDTERIEHSRVTWTLL